MKSTYSGFCISFVCGSPGSGKSYCMVLDVVQRLLSSFTGCIVTNLPLNVDVIAGYVGAKLKVDPKLIAARIVLVDKDTLGRWQSGTGGPWDYKADIAAGNDFVLDECHLYCKKKGQGVTARNERWEKWLGEVRHEGWRRLVFVTQDESKVGAPITQHAELRFELTNAERRRDPIFRIPLSFWYELRASFTREYSATISVVEYRRTRGKLKQEHVERLVLDPFWFSFYQSYVAAGGGAGVGAGAEPIVREYQRRPSLLPKYVSPAADADGKVGRPVLWAPVWLWFIKSHWWRFGRTMSVVCFIVWLSLFGGGKVLLTRYMKVFAPVGVADSNPPQVAPREPTIADEFKEKAGGKAAPRAPAGHPTTESLGGVIKRLPESDRQILVQELKAGSADYRRVDMQRAALVAQMEKSQKAVKVVAVTPNEAWFTDPPCSCKIGKVLDDGPYKGKLVKLISVADGFVELSDGVKLFVGRGVEPPGVSSVQSSGPRQNAAAVSSGSGDVKSFVPKPVRGVGGAPKSGKLAPGTSEGNNFGAGDADHSLLTSPSAAVGPVGGSGAVSGSADGDSGVTGPASK